MEVAGGGYQLINVKRNNHGLHHLVYCEETRSYLYITRRNGVQIRLEWAGMDETDATAGFGEFCEEAV